MNMVHSFATTMHTLSEFIEVWERLELAEFGDT